MVIPTEETELEPVRDFVEEILDVLNQGDDKTRGYNLYYVSIGKKGIEQLKKVRELVAKYFS